MKFLLLLLLSAVTAFGQPAWSYLGIPYPTDNVPGAIMPILPTGADTPGWPYDPCTIATPTFVDGATQYYIDSVNGNDGTAGNGGRGSVALPRKTLPFASGTSVTFPEGTQVFITANSSIWTAGTNHDININGTAANPCWIIGVGGKPNFGGDQFHIHGQHLIIDGMRWQATNGVTRIKIGESTGGPMQYCTIRNCTMTGLGTAGSGGNSVIGGNGNINTPAKFVCIYRNEISNFGKWDRPDANGVDRHGVQPYSYTRWWWIIENAIYHMEGDSVQVCTSNSNQGIYAFRPHYIYIAGNDMYENYEQAVDNKNCYHVFISQNRIRGHRNPYVAANRTAVLVSNDNEGWLADYQWALFNSIDDSSTAIKIAGNAASELDGSIPPVPITGQKSYVIGNRITNCNNGIYIDAVAANGQGTNAPLKMWPQGAWVVDNTIQVTTSGIHQQRISQANPQYATYEISGNLIHRATTGADIDMLSTGSTYNTINVLRNLGYSPAGPLTFTSNGAYDLKVGNLESTNPLLVNPPNDMRLEAVSPAIGANAESSVYQLFQDMYGLDIQKDYFGTVRPLGGTWDIGALEYNEGYIPPTPVAPVNSVLPVINGTPTQGQTLTATSGTWSGGPTYAYQWTRDTVDIAGSTASTHLLTAVDVGTLIRVRVTATTSGGSVSATSLPTTAIAGPPPPPPGVATAGAVNTTNLNVGP